MLHRGLRDDLPVAVIGAGPVGLAAAVHLTARGLRPLVFEAGDAVGAHVRTWGHVQLFSPWRYVVDEAARELLEAEGWVHPDPETLPTGSELVAEYLEPLARHPLLAPHLRLGHRVVAVTRQGMDKVKSRGREESPFEVVVETPGGKTERHLARGVLDASGTWSTPNPMGAGGLPVEGEAALRSRIHYGIPDMEGPDRSRHAGSHTLVVGSGHSAMGAVAGLAALAEEAPGTRVTWAIRREDPGLMFGGGRADALPARGSLGDRLRRLVASGAVDFLTGFRSEGLEEEPGGTLRVRGGEGRAVTGVDQVVVATGFRPDLSLARELRVELDPWLEAPARLAPLVDPNLHSCGSVPPHGYLELRHPEPDFYLVGMKSYGRAPTFLLLTGYEQVRSVVAALAGDMTSALDVRLVLPETGVCSTATASPTTGHAVPVAASLAGAGAPGSGPGAPCCG